LYFSEGRRRSSSHRECEYIRLAWRSRQQNGNPVCSTKISGASHSHFFFSLRRVVETIAKDSKGRSHQAFVASRLPMQFKAHMVNHAIYYLIIRNHQSVQETTTIRFWFKQPYNYCFTNQSIPTTYYDPLSTYLTVLEHEFCHMVATYYL